MSRARTLRTALMAAAAGLAAPALAQQPPPTVERRLPEERRPAIEIPAEELILTGEYDLVLLRKRKFFTLSADAAPRYTSNAFLSDSRREGDIVFNGDVTLRAETRIALRYTVFAEAGLFLARYDDNAVLDHDGVTGGIGGTAPVGPWRFSLAYRGTDVRQRGFGDHIITQHSAIGAVAYTFLVGKNTAVSPLVVLSRVWAEPDDFTRTSVQPGAAVLHALASDLILRADARLEGLFYDDFFESSLGRSRQDFGLSGAATLRWTPRPWVSASAGIAARYGDSTVNSLDYKEASITPAIRVEARF